MTLVVDKFQSLLPPRTRATPSGWSVFNAPCCHHRGHKQDKRKRAGVRFDNGIVYNCFNCKFSTGWQPGSPLGEKMKILCRWLGASDDTVKDMIFEALKSESPEYRPTEIRTEAKFGERDLPKGSLALKEWIAADLPEDLENKLALVVSYIIDRGFDPMSDDFYWSPAEDGYDSRVLIPFRFKGKIVGHTARKVDQGKPKYLSHQDPNYVFNFDRQTEDQKYILVTEGPFDALAVNGVAVLTNEVSDQQAHLINSLDAEKIVIPDQDRAGLRLFDRAVELGWSVASPTWDTDVKDCADAVNRYGKLFVVVDAIKTASKGAIKINMAKKKLEQKLEKIENEITD